ncbi:MAG: hypothetical protein HQM10_16790 [Candidatus Riflebacteria bacterium]|nr:hypothetical protein [Candidatus Riflebacteria bacterium]
MKRSSILIIFSPVFLVAWLIVACCTDISFARTSAFDGNAAITISANVSASEVIAEMSKVSSWQRSKRDAILLNGAVRVKTVSDAILLADQTKNKEVKTQIFIESAKKVQSSDEVQLILGKIALNEYNLRNQILLTAARALSSTSEILWLAHQSSEKNISDEIFLLAIKKASSISELKKIAESTSTVEIDKAVAEYSLQFITDPYTATELAKSLDEKAREKVLMRGMEISKTIFDRLNLIQYSTDSELIESLSSVALEKTDNWFDLALLAKYAYRSSEAENRILSKAITKCTSLSDHINLIKSSGAGVEMRDKIALDAVKFARTNNDLKALSQYAGTNYLKQTILAVKLSDQNASDAYQPTQALIDSVARKYKIRLYDQTAQWLNNELVWVEEVLQTLPAQFVQCTSVVGRERSMGSPTILGQTKTNSECDRNVLSGECSYDLPEIMIMDIACRNSEEFKATLVHEMAHNYVAKANHSNIQDAWDNQFWNGNQPRTPSATDYGNTNSQEDLAESVSQYWANPEILSKNNPERYEFIKKYILSG